MESEHRLTKHTFLRNARPSVLRVDSVIVQTTTAGTAASAPATLDRMPTTTTAAAPARGTPVSTRRRRAWTTTASPSTCWSTATGLLASVRTTATEKKTAEAFPFSLAKSLCRKSQANTKLPENVFLLTWGIGVSSKIPRFFLSPTAVRWVLSCRPFCSYCFCSSCPTSRDGFDLSRALISGTSPVFSRSSRQRMVGAVGKVVTCCHPHEQQACALDVPQLFFVV